MKNNDVIRIGVAEASVIIRSGVAYTLKHLPNLRILPVALASPDAYYIVIFHPVINLFSI